MSRSFLLSLFLFLILCSFLCSHSRTKTSITEGNHHSRRLLASATSFSADNLSNYWKAKTKDHQPKKAVETSLRKAPHSAPNPTQNK
ncbi:hypothetical protein Scep_003103 [Stephania cephalantha]|uniref:Uncharacterized protein n=1 Tax=Stephania cephalantha TaxID=152367 RepID=A0AAP0KRK3_9MAGN